MLRGMCDKKFVPPDMQSAAILTGAAPLQISIETSRYAQKAV